MLTKEDGKITKYSPLEKEIRKMYRMSTNIVPLEVGCFGVVSGRLEGFLKDLGIPDELGGMQASAVIVTTLILQTTLSL